MKLLLVVLVENAASFTDIGHKGKAIVDLLHALFVFAEKNQNEKDQSEERNRSKDGQDVRDLRQLFGVSYGAHGRIVIDERRKVRAVTVETAELDWIGDGGKDVGDVGCANVEDQLFTQERGEVGESGDVCEGAASWRQGESLQPGERCGENGVGRLVLAGNGER